MRARREMCFCPVSVAKEAHGEMEKSRFTRGSDHGLGLEASVLIAAYFSQGFSSRLSSGSSGPSRQTNATEFGPEFMYLCTTPSAEGMHHPQVVKICKGCSDHSEKTL